MKEPFPDVCYDDKSADYYKILIEDKPIYIFANHAIAIRAWHAEKKDKKLNLITFDEHTDTFAPIRRYISTYLDGNEHLAVEILEKLRLELSDSKLKRLLTPGAYLPKTTNMKRDANIVHRKLWNDEHIATAIFLGIIDKAYICSPNHDIPIRSEQKIEDVYSKIIYLSHAYDGGLPYSKMRELSKKEEELVYLNMKSINSFYNERMLSLIDMGLNNSSPYILDIDLDYIRDLNVLEKPIQEYAIFKDLVRRAIAITIATEPSWVQDASEWYNLNVSDYNKVCEPDEVLPLRNWNSQQVLDTIIKKIEEMLTDD